MRALAVLSSARDSIVLSMLVASLNVAAEPRVWTFAGAQFNDGTFITGSFSYDDATRTSARWNIRVTGGADLAPFTYVPGNSTISYYLQADGREFIFFGSEPAGRGLWIYPLAPLDGSASAVQLRTAPDTTSEVGSWDGFFTWYAYREAVAGSLTLSSPGPVVTIQVDEFFNAQLQRYFMTASAGEKQDLDTGIHPGWVRTGESFQAYATGSRASGSINPVCRYYGNPLRGLDSHFYSADAGECTRVGMARSDHWLLESDNVFQINLPDVVTGACPAGTIPVYRLWNQRADSNHRYTTRATIKEQMLAAGYVAEGYGPGGVAMCAVE